MFASNQDRFLLDINGDTGCRVLAFTGNETMDHPYEFTVTFISIEPQSMEELLQKPVCLTLLPVHEYDAAGQETKQRHIHGMILACRQEEMHGNQYQYQYTLTLAPRLSLLAYNNRYRIFQQMSVPEIVRQILKEAGITDFDPRLHEQHLTREYCVQYNESDLAFVKRILSEEGIHFHFEHSKEAHTLVIQDTLSGLAKSAPVMFRPHNGQVAECAVLQKWQVHREITSGVSSGRGLDFTRPHWIESTAEFSHNDTGQTRTALRHDTWPLPVNEDEKVLKQASRRHMEFLERLQHGAKGTTDSTDCQPGTWLPVSEHPDEKSNGEWFVFAVEHEARQPGVKEELADPNETSHYEARVQAIHNHFNWRPKKIEKPPVQGILSAVVTGPSEKEIHTDEYGRVKVQFPWDREGKGNENSSAWLRVTQQWAGKGYGSFSLPRVGHEVVVSFLNGDIDQPLVTGSLHNGDNTPPYALPDHQTRSGIKTLSSPDGKTDNELRFEDKAGSEQIYLHAGKDMATQVDNDQHVVVEKDHHHTTKNNHYQHIQGEHHTTVEKDLLHTVQGNTHSRTEGSVQEKTGANHLLEAGKVMHIKAGANVVIEGGASLSIKAGGQYLTINSGGLFSSKKVKTGGSPGMAPLAAPQSATLPGGIDLAGIGQVPVGIGVIDAGKPGDSNSLSGDEEQKEEEKEQKVQGIALMPLRYALVNTAPDKTLASIIRPSLEKMMKPVGVRTVRKGFLYAFHDSAPDVLFEYELTPESTGSTRVSRTGIYEKEKEKPPVESDNQQKETRPVMLLQQQSEAQQCILMPEAGQLLVLFCEQKMTEFKRSQFLAMNSAGRNEVMQSVSINTPALEAGAPHIMPFSLMPHAVAEFSSSLPALTGLSDPEQNLAGYLKMEDPYFWSSSPFSLAGNGGAAAFQASVPVSPAITGGAGIIVEDIVGLTNDIHLGAFQAVHAQQTWKEEKRQGGTPGKKHTNESLLRVADLITQFTCVTPDMIDQVLQEHNVSKELAAQVSDDLLEWTRAMHEHLMIRERMGDNLVIPDNPQAQWMKFSRPEKGEEDQSQYTGLLVDPPGDPECATTLGKNWKKIKSVLSNEVNQVFQLRMHGEGDRSFSSGMEDFVDYDSMFAFTAEARKHMSAWRLVQKGWVHSLIAVQDRLSTTMVAFDLSSAPGLQHALSITHNTLLNLGTTEEGRTHIQNTLLVRGDSLLRVLLAAEPDKKLIEQAGNIKEWTEFVLVIAKNELINGGIKAALLFKALSSGARLPDNSVLEQPTIGSLYSAIEAQLVPHILAAKNLWAYASSSPRPLSFADKVLSAKLKGAFMWFISTLGQQKMDYDNTPVIERGKADLENKNKLAEALQTESKALRYLITVGDNPGKLKELDRASLRFPGTTLPDSLSMEQLKRIARKKGFSQEVMAEIDNWHDKDKLPALLQKVETRAQTAIENLKLTTAMVTPLSKLGDPPFNRPDITESLKQIREQGVQLGKLFKGVEGFFIVLVIYDLGQLITGFANKMNVTLEDRVELIVKVIGDVSYLWLALLTQKKKGLEKALESVTEQSDILNKATKLQKTVQVMARLNGLSMLASGIFGAWQDWHNANDAASDGQPGMVSGLYRTKAFVNGLTAMTGADSLLLGASKRTLWEWKQRLFHGASQLGDSLDTPAVNEGVGQLAEEETGEAGEKIAAKLAQDAAERMIAGVEVLGYVGMALGTISLVIDFFIYELTLDKLTLWGKHSAWSREEDQGWSQALHLYHLATVIQVPALRTIRQDMLMEMAIEQATGKYPRLGSLTLTLPGLTAEYARTLQTEGKMPSFCVMVETNHAAQWQNQLKSEATLQADKPASGWFKGMGRYEWVEITRWISRHMRWKEEKLTLILDFTHLPPSLVHALSTVECRLRYQPPMLDGFVPEKVKGKTVRSEQVTAWQFSLENGVQGQQKALEPDDLQDLKPADKTLFWQPLPLIV